MELAEKLSNIEQRLESLPESIEKVDLLNDYAWEVKDINPQRSIDLSNAAHAMAKKLGYEKGAVRSLYYHAVCKHLISDYEDALRELLYVLSAYQNLDDKISQGHVLNWIGNVHYRLGDYPNAINYYLKSLKLKEETGDKLGEAYSYNDLGRVQARLNDAPKAFAYLFKSLALKEELGNLQGQAYTLNELGETYERIGDMQRALDYYQKALEMRRRVGDKRGEGVTLANIGALYQQQNNLVEAEKFYLQSLEISKEVGHKHGVVIALTRLGTLFIERNDIAQALQHLSTALAVAEERKLKEWVYKIHEAMAQAYERIRDFEKALFHFKKFHSLKEEVLNREMAQKLRSISIQYDAEKAQREMEIYRLKNIELVKANQELQKLMESLREANAQKTALLLQVQEQAKVLERQAREDGLTRLLNRRYLDIELSQELERARRYERTLSVAMLDIDFFKQVNDRFSHQVGDEVLRELAKIFRSESRSNDIIARYGGEEFVIVMPETPLSKAVAACEKIRLSVQNHDWQKMHPDLAITISIGVVEAKGYHDLDAVLHAADEKLYEAKRTGRNKVCF